MENIVYKNLFYKIGNFIQKIIIKNVILFIALGFISLFSNYNSEFLSLKNILVMYAIPLSIAYTTGNLIDEKHGGAGAVICTALTIYNTTTENLLEIILISTAVGFSIKFFKEKIVTKLMPGFEMFFINVCIPLISIGYFFAFSKIIPYLNIFFNKTVTLLLNTSEGILGISIITILIETGKIFFVNNFINHGILAVVGYNQIMEKGESIFFLLETNPGPGLGVLLALYFFRKEKRKNIFSNMVIEFFGGIHEVYFPYIFKNFKLILPLICGGLAGNIFFYMFDVALSSVPSPGSVIILMVLATSSRFYLLAGVLLSAFVSFSTAYIILKSKEKNIETTEISEEKETENKIFIYILCNGGMGSSHIGKTFLQNNIKKNNIKNIEINSTYIGDKIEKVDFIITHNNFLNRVKSMYPSTEIVGLDDYMNRHFYEKFVETYFIKNKTTIKIQHKNINNVKDNSNIDIQLGLKSISENNAFDLIKKEIHLKKDYMDIFEKGIILFYNINCEENEKIVIHQYPYGLKNNNIFLIIGISIQNTENYEKIYNSLKNISQNQNVLSELEISDDKKYFETVFNLKNLLKKGGM